MFLSLRNGSILIIVLWIIIILTILAVSISAVASAQVFFTRQYRRQAAEYFIARAGIAQCVAELNRDKEANTYDALNEGWSNNPELFNEKQVGNGFLTVSYEYSNYLTTLSSEGESVLTSTVCGMVDEERKININTASVTVLQALFQDRAALSSVQAKEIADSIIDWRDTDENRRENGAESSYYQGLSSPYSCKNNKFDIPEELMLIKGVRPEAFQSVKEFVTVYGDGKVNINTASSPVLKALGVDLSLAEKIIRCRSGSDEIEGTEDDEVFTQPAAIISTLNKKQTITQGETNQINNLITTNAISVKSTYFQIISYGYLADINTGEVDRKNSKKITCIINRNGKIVYWRE
ncbi:MAG: general secretion pathway protein GspK [Planctomycetes bacterium]|nr:general secretion pathway protein GspK [Planctomycetota bacterium]